MVTLTDVQVAQAAQAEKIAALVAEVETANGKTDALITVANATKDALVALQGQLANGTLVSQADLQNIIDGMNAGATAAQTAQASLVTQEGETDAAAAADAP